MEVELLSFKVFVNFSFVRVGNSATSVQCHRGATAVVWFGEPVVWLVEGRLNRGACSVRGSNRSLHRGTGNRVNVTT